MYKYPTRSGLRRLFSFHIDFWENSSSIAARLEFNPLVTGTGRKNDPSVHEEIPTLRTTQARGEAV